VIEEEKSNYEMYYCHGTGWIENFPCYDIRKATSTNGLDWLCDNETLIGCENSATSRVAIQKINNRWEIWCAQKTIATPYEMLHGISSDKKTWSINDPQIPRGNVGDWDYEMICYPAILKSHMFYNGNGYGASGIGLAEWVDK
jgi:hypothetical protein